MLGFRLPLHRTSEKGRKFVQLRLIYPPNAVRLRSIRRNDRRSGANRFSRSRGASWAEPARRASFPTGTTANRRSRRLGRSRTTPEDGDIATPKRDRSGNDDEPL